MVKRAPARRRPRKAKPGTKGLTPAECQLQEPAGAAAEAAQAIGKAGGCVVGLYKDPLAGQPILLATLPSLHEGVDTSTPNGRLLFGTFAL